MVRGDSEAWLKDEHGREGEGEGEGGECDVEE